MTRVQVWDAGAYQRSLEDSVCKRGMTVYVPSGDWSSVPIPHLLILDAVPDTKWIEELEALIGAKVCEIKTSGTLGLTAEWTPKEATR